MVQIFFCIQKEVLGPNYLVLNKAIMKFFHMSLDLFALLEHLQNLKQDVYLAINVLFPLI